MSSGNGVNAAKATEVLATLGYDRGKLAADLGVHPRTVARWESGEHQPSRRNRAKLRAFIGEVLLVELAGRDTVRVEARRKRLNEAATALMTPAEREAEKAERDEFEQRMRAKRAAIVAQRQPEPHRSAFADLSPFTIFGQQDAEMAAVEAVGF